MTMMMLILKWAALLQEVTEDVTESSPCRQVAAQLVELHMNSESLRRCLNDLRHSVHVSKTRTDIYLFLFRMWSGHWKMFSIGLASSIEVLVRKLDCSVIQVFHAVCNTLVEVSLFVAFHNILPSFCWLFISNTWIPWWALCYHCVPIIPAASVS